MTSNLSKTLFTFSASILLVAVFATSSDADRMLSGLVPFKARSSTSFGFQ